MVFPVRDADATALSERACIWTLGGLLDGARFEQLLREARLTLGPFVRPDGSVAFEMPALINTAGSIHRFGSMVSCDVATSSVI